MTETELYDTTGPDGPSMTRRTALKTLAAGGTAAAVGTGAGGDQLAPVGDAEAIACGGLCLGAAAVGAGIAVGWALREYEVIGADTPADGLSGDALRNEIVNTVQSRKSTNASTILDNRNILKAGLKNTAYGDGKLAAIQALNNESQKSTVQTAATDAVDAYEETVITNFFRSWNEAANEAMALGTAADQHADVDVGYLQPWRDNFVSIRTIRWDPANFLSDGSLPYAPASDTQTYTFANGNTFTVDSIVFQLMNIERDGSSSMNYNEFSINPLGDAEFSPIDMKYLLTDGGSLQYMDAEPWANALSELETAFQNARDGLILWVDNVYSQVQAGELNTDELLTSRELAAMTADQEGYNQAIADLMALNISVNLEREAEIHLPNDDVTLYGSLGTTGDTTLSVGTVDPSADSFSYYFSYDVSQGSGTWSDYNTGIDGGVVTFTSEPWESTEYAIDTSAGETATVSASAFTDQGDGTWTVDVSDQLETAITNIDQVLVHSANTETQYETVQLTETFEIVTFTDSEGNEYDSADHTSSQPHTDTNYITQEEWDQRENRYQELIDKYEESQNDGGGAGGFLDGGNSTLLAALAAVAGGAVLFGGNS